MWRDPRWGSLGCLQRNASHRQEGLASTRSPLDATVRKVARSPKERAAGREHDQSALNTCMKMSQEIHCCIRPAHAVKTFGKRNLGRAKAK